MRRIVVNTFGVLGILGVMMIIPADVTAQPSAPPKSESPDTQELPFPGLQELMSREHKEESKDPNQIQEEIAKIQEAFYQEKWEQKWAPTEPGTYVALAALEIQRLRVQHGALAYEKLPQNPVSPSFPRFTVILTLGASPNKDEPALKEAFFHTGSLSEALAVLRDLKSGTVKGLWIERFEAKNISGNAGAWWEIRGMEY